MPVLLVVVLLGQVVPASSWGGGVAAALMLGAQLVFCLPGLERLRGWWVPVVQAGLLWFGGPASFPAASTLLVVRGPVRWALFAGVIALGWARGGETFVAWAMMPAVQGLMLYVLMRMRDLGADLRTSRRELAARYVARERERAERALDTALGAALAEIVRLAAAGRTAEIVALARRSADQVRQRPPEVRMPAADALTPRFALRMVLVVTGWFPLGGALYLAQRGLPAVLVVVAFVYAAVPMGLFAYAMLTRRRKRLFWTLPLLALLTLLAWVPVFTPDTYRDPHGVLEMAANLALSLAAVLVLLPPRVAWPLAGAMLAAIGLVPWLLYAAPLTFVGLVLVKTAGTAATFYGLTLFTRLVRRVHETRLALAEVALVQERRRIARDVHDLLGYGLSAITVKAELAARTPDRAAGELADVTELAQRALADLRTIPAGGEPDLSLGRELDSARTVLRAAGTDVRDDIPHTDLPPAVDALLATVVREAVTNVLRHSNASRVDIDLADDGAAVSLRVANDGAARESGPPGQGLANLTARVAAHGGALTTEPGPGYRLAVTVPRPVPEARRASDTPVRP